MDRRSPSSPVERKHGGSPEPLLKRRGYLHFDPPPDLITLSGCIKDPTRVAAWPFFPLIRTTLRTRKVRRVGKDLEPAEKEREICYASHRDAALYEHYSQQLGSLYERDLEARGLERCVTAFRSLGRSNISLALEAFRWIESNTPCVALAFDVKQFFPSLDHGKLKAAWCKLLTNTRLPPDHFAIFRSLTHYSWVDQDKLYKSLGISTHNPRANGRRRLCSAQEFRAKVRDGKLIATNGSCKGIPQGTPISALLSNIYMTDIDAALAEFAKSTDGLYRRYCDDILVVVSPSRESEARRLVEKLLNDHCLQLQHAKTLTCSFEEPHAPVKPSLQYLGLVYCGDKVLLRSSGIARFYAKMRAGVSLAKQTRRRHAREQGVPPESLPLYSRKLNRLYTHLGKRNYVRYALRASNECGQVAIKRQIRRHWDKLREEKSKPP